MRLIDADAALDYFKNKYNDIGAGCYPYNIVVWDLVKYIEKMPTAYNVDKVVEELKDAVHFIRTDKGIVGTISPATAIEIVRKGGVE